MNIEIIPAYERLEEVRLLFREYADALGFDLSYQDFETELRELPGKYAPPDGRLFLALCGEEAAGCVALRPLGEGRCEMKRLYVKSCHRGKKLGERLVEAVVEAARQAGCRELLLDTLPQMREAIGLYERLGFEPVAPYYPSPMPGTRYLRLLLQSAESE